MTQEKTAVKIDRKARLQIPTQPMPKQAPEVRIHNRDEVALPIDLETAKIEASRCLQCPAAPCRKACPVHNEIPAALALLENGDVIGAANKFRETSTMPEICGRLCPQERLCEGHCVVCKHGSPVAIGRLEAFVADYQRNQSGFPVPEPADATGKKVAIVGAGPAGLCVAEELTKLGHACTVFDAWPQPGGLLIYGIPAFKMDKTIVDQKVDHLRSLGIEFVPETVVGKDITVDELFGRGFQAVFLGHGAAKENVVDVPGIDLNGKYRILGHELGGVYWAMDFLLRGNVAPDRLPARMREPLKVGNKVAVIGGGDTAMDCLRSAIRLGAEQVTCMYRRSEAEMPGAEEERKNAMLEGAEFQYLVAPLGLYGDDDRHVRKIECQRMKLGELDESGRRRFRPIAGSNFTVDVDTVVFAIGFRVARVVVNGCAELETGAWDEIVVDEEAGATSRLGVFAGGDCVHGADLVVTALASAKRAAAGIHRYLSEELS